MPPTFKDTEPSSSEASTTRPAASGSPQTVALDVPVTVNGVRPVEHSDKREPFAEATKTVLVHSAGAVIRLASAVVPGQLLFLTNDKTQKEVVCQVVKSKSHGNLSGYVELEFTEPVQGFWGLGFPAERAPGVSAATRPAVLSPLGQNMDSRPAVSNVFAKPAEPSAAVPAEEFKTEIKQDSRSMHKADFLAPADSSTQALTIDTERLQEQLSTLVFADAVTDEAPHSAAQPTSGAGALSDATARIFEIAANEPTLSKAEARPEREEPAASVIPAPKNAVSSTPAFEAEEVKIPAWLEPLARNAAIPAPPEPVAGANASSSSTSISSASTATTSSSSNSEFEELSAAEPQRPAAPAPATRPSVSTKRAVVPAAPPVFGRTLLGSAAAAPAKASRSNKGILITAIAAGIVLATAGVTWYLRQSSDPAANAETTNSSALRTPATTLPAAQPPSSTASTPAPSSNAYADTKESFSPESKPKPPASGADVRAVSSSGSAAKQQPAAISERVPKPATSVDAGTTPSPSEEEVEPEAQRPSLGRVRLAKPKVGHDARTSVNGDAAPTLETDGEQLPAGDSPLSGGLLAGNANQPAAPGTPTPVGGDVVIARLISSVPPAYPALARTQHIQGDVRIDALIGANGRVTSMKVISGPTLLHQAAMDALRQWKYQPATLDGKPVALHLTVTIQFHLQ